MTQHVLNDIVSDWRFFWDEERRPGAVEDFRGLTWTEGGKALQRAFKELLPRIEAIIRHYHDDEAGDFGAAVAEGDATRVFKHVYLHLRTLRDYLETERLASFRDLAPTVREDTHYDDDGIPF